LKREIFSFTILALISLALISFRLKIDTIKEAPQRVSSQIALLFSQVKATGGKTISSIVEAYRALEENERLKGELVELKQKLALLRALEEENERLKALLGIKKHYRLVSIPARVVGWTGDYWQHRFILDKGKIHGVKRGMAVVGAGGIVGQVRVVYRDHCIATGTTDPEFSIHVEDYRSKVRGIARGNGRMLIVDYIPPSMDVKLGDLIVSTGIGGVFPPGLFVGKIVKVERSIESKFLNVQAIPTDRIENNHYVLVMGEMPVGKKKIKKAKR